MIADDLKPLAQPISALKPLKGNPRKGDVEAVARSYQQFGQRKPIVAKRDGTIIAGNHQLLAAKQLGWTEIAVVFVDDDDKTAKAFALADNRTGDLGSYDNESLLKYLNAISKDAELLLATGYDESFIADLTLALEAPPSLDDLAGEWENTPIDPTPDKKTVVLVLDNAVAELFEEHLATYESHNDAILDLLK